MESQEKKPTIQTNEVVRWIDASGLSRVLNSGEWLTLQALMKTESRLVGLRSSNWSDKELGQWFQLRAGEELTVLTGLTERRQREHLSSLDEKWNLIEVKPGTGRCFTKVRFIKKTLELLSRYCIPRLPAYQGGLYEKEECDIPDQVYFWIRPDLEGYGWHWRKDVMTRLVNDAAGFGPPVPDDIRDILANSQREHGNERRAS